MGLQFILPVGLFTWGGIWLGRKLDLEVLFVLLGLALGFAVGFWSLYKELYGREIHPWFHHNRIRHVPPPDILKLILA